MNRPLNDNTAVSLQRSCLVVLPTHDSHSPSAFLHSYSKNQYRGLPQLHCNTFQVGPHGSEIVVQTELVILLFGSHWQQQQPFELN